MLPNDGENEALPLSLSRHLFTMSLLVVMMMVMVPKSHKLQLMKEEYFSIQRKLSFQALQIFIQPATDKFQ